MSIKATISKINSFLKKDIYPSSLKAIEHKYTKSSNNLVEDSSKTLYDLPFKKNIEDYESHRFSEENNNKIINNYLNFDLNKINFKQNFIQYNRTKSNISENNISLKNKFSENIRMITISPAGYKGIYSYGICNYIKKNYNLDNYIFSGASAGAWNALLLCIKKDPYPIKDEILYYSLNNTNNILELQLCMKKRLLQKYSTEDFNLNKLFIGVTTLQKFNPETIIYNDFQSLEDALDCCIASSHIPFITGGIINKYHNLYSFDGGFSKYPYLNNMDCILHITPDIWSKNKTSDTIFDSSLFYKNKYNFTKLYNDGYDDSHNNKKVLDAIFIKQ
jgi:hypothetical protein